MKSYQSLFLFLCLALSSCAWQSKPKPSVILVAVENLSGDELECESQSSDRNEGLKVLCEDAVRFSQAYTPSTMAQASMASVFTGLYPQKHRVWHNGSDYLSGKIRTIAELAYEIGYKTLFLSGGAPIWSKSGLSQGFQVFDDTVHIRPGQYFRPAKDLVQAAMQWIDQSFGAPFFMTLYFADLQFPAHQTLDEDGQPRAMSRESQKTELFTRFHELKEFLEDKHLWQSSYVVFFGTNGHDPNFRLNEYSSYNLHAEMTRVPLFIKPPRKQRDLGLDWRVDKNVSLVDLGATLWEVFESYAPDSTKTTKLGPAELDGFSLVKAVNAPNSDWPEKRYLVIESAWPLWRGIGTTRFSIRSGQYFLIYDQEPKFYNTLADRSERSPISQTDPDWKSQESNLSFYLEQLGYAPWRPMATSLNEKLVLAQDFFKGVFKGKEDLEPILKLSRLRDWDFQLKAWAAHSSLESKDLETFKRMAEESEYMPWKLVYESLESNRISKKSASEPCLGLFLPKFRELDQRRLKECNDPLVQALYDWKQSQGLEDELAKQEIFLRQLVEYSMDREIAALNYQNGLAWDVTIDLPNGLSKAELILALPDNLRLSKISHARLHKLWSDREGRL